MREVSVHLRAMEPTDLDFLYQIENDSDIWDVGLTNVPYSRYTLHNYVATASSDIFADRQVRLMIETAQQELVGVVDLVNFDPRHLRAEVGLVILKNQRRKGYGSAAIAKMLDYARRICHLHQVYAVVDEQNLASQKLFSGMGFQTTSELKNWLFDGENHRNALLMQFFLRKVT